MSADQTTTGAPSPLPMRCRCGNAQMVPGRVLARMGVVPASAVGMWSMTCDQCASAHSVHPWGWTLAGGREVGCLHGDDEAEDAGVASLAAARDRSRRLRHA